MTLADTSDSLALNVLPAGMQNTELVLNEETSIAHGLEQFSNCEADFIPSTVSIENSSHVVIGPVTNFHGPVTIYQNANGTPTTNPTDQKLDAKLVKSESTSSETSHPIEKSNKNSLFRSKQTKYIVISLIMLLIIVIIATITTFTLKSEDLPSLQRFDGDNNSNGNVDDNNLKPIGSGTIIKKELWGGRPALNFTVKLQHPAHFVIISHTVTPFCNDFVKCSARARSIQDYHVGSLESPDIGYNFLIGGDGNVYVGRGWDIKNFHAPDTIGISFIGNYLYDSLTPEMIQTTKMLLDIGVRKGKLDEKYKLIGQNQTFPSESPGPHVYKIIKTWPHFDPKTYSF